MTESSVALNDSPGAREKLIEAASRIMRQNDTIDLSLSELSLVAGLNSALVKYYFGNKNGLLRAVLDHDMTAIVEGLNTLMARDMPPEEKLRRHVAGVVETFWRVPYLNRLMMRLVRDFPPAEAEAIAEQFLKPIARAYDRLVAEGVEQGVFRPVNPRHLNMTITGMADRFFTARLVTRYCYDAPEITEDMRDEYRDYAIDLIMAGILKPKD